MSLIETWHRELVNAIDAVWQDMHNEPRPE